MSQMGKFFISGGGTGFVSTLTADNGSVIVPDGADNINIVGVAAGENINTGGVNGSSSLTINLDTTIHWPNTNMAGTTGVIYLNNFRFMHNYGDNNTFLGQSAGNFSLTVGTANANTGLGNGSLESLTTGDENLGCGNAALANLTSGTNNCAVGDGALNFLTTGSYVTALGDDFLLGVGSAYTTESNNLVINNAGQVADANVIRIGTQGAGTGQQNTCYIAGITGVNVGSVATVVSIATGSGQLGTTTLTAGVGVTITPGANTITIAASGTSNFNYTNVHTTPYVVLSTDEYLSVDCSGMAITVNLPNAPATGRSYIIKDRTGNAFTNNITVTTVGGVVDIDGATTFVMNTNFEAIQVLFNGTSYEIF